MIDKHRVKKNFSSAKNYDDFTSYHNLTLAKISRTIKSFFGDYGAADKDRNKENTKNILDIGCGTAQGYFAVKNSISADYFDYFGLDFAAGLLKEANRKLKSRNNGERPCNAYLICGDAEFLPLRDKKFDVIFSNMTLHWLNNIDSFLDKCYSVLKNGGIIVLSFLISGTLKELEKIFEDSMKSKYKKLHTFPKLDYITEKIDKSGFTIDYSEVFEYIETAESSFQLLKRINMLGAKNAVNAKISGTALLRRALARYDKNYRNADGLPYCTYKIAYLILKTA